MEVAVATALVGIIIVPALQTAGASIRASAANAERMIGDKLAADLMAEISLLSFKEPVEPAVFGPESSETTGNRLLFDDVDDYASWNKSPPTAQDGTPLPNRSNWRQQVTVDFVSPASLSTSPTDTKLKRITVAIYRSERLVTQLTALKAELNE